MLLGVVSDTHNNLKNIDKIITLFNKAKVSLVVHTGDICNSKSLQKFSKLKSKLIGVYGNNDRNETDLDHVVNENFFEFDNPPKLISCNNKKIAIFHEPELIERFLINNIDIDIVLHGHTHRYRNEIKDNILFFNPGESAGIMTGKNAIGLIDLKNLTAKRIFF